MTPFDDLLDCHHAVSRRPSGLDLSVLVQCYKLGGTPVSVTFPGVGNGTAFVKQRTFVTYTSTT
ncbi:hypothetical protein [Nonomuraea sp. NPDC005650]|uniref:hypothetical protein n=1 Tax=Nonomuraea sp. NPDC005650 TaxID=3157045 RepID=UPI0033A3809F